MLFHAAGDENAKDRSVISIIHDMSSNVKWSYNARPDPGVPSKQQTTTSPKNWFGSRTPKSMLPYSETRKNKKWLVHWKQNIAGTHWH
jgi:hypothetical protein